MKIILTAIVLSISASSFTQEIEKQKFVERLHPSYTIGWHFNPDGYDGNLKASLQTSILYELKPRLYTGIGVGVEKHSTSILPVFGDVRYLLSKTKNRMYLNVKVGHNNVIGNQDYANRSYSGGMYSYFGIGHFVSLSENLDLELGVGFKHLKINSNDDFNGDYYILPFPGPGASYLETFNRFEMRIGLFLK